MTLPEYIKRRKAEIKELAHYGDEFNTAMERFKLEAFHENSLQGLLDLLGEWVKAKNPVAGIESPSNIPVSYHYSIPAADLLALLEEAKQDKG